MSVSADESAMFVAKTTFVALREAAMKRAPSGASLFCDPTDNNVVAPPKVRENTSR